MGEVLVVKDLTSEYTIIYLELKYIANHGRQKVNMPSFV